MNNQKKTFERVNQKRRTRVELLRTARDMIAEGSLPSVAEIADRARISRATAYRYFSTSEELVREAALDGVVTTLFIEPDAEADGPVDVEKRLDQLVSDVFKIMRANERLFRAALLSSSATAKQRNDLGEHRRALLTKALQPFEKHVPPRVFQRLVHALCLVMGIETFIVMKDICELEPEEGEEVLRWTAQTLLAEVAAGQGSFETTGTQKQK
ncbi:MAG: TetR/AcrR family transcriptional regulator [Shinella sp.]|nr:TetR/AcrR family transcriptional regulator [Shinella sp.]